MKISEINPYVRRAIPSEIKPGSTIRRRIILDYELLYVEDGGFHLCYNDKMYSCKKGDIILLCPGIPHSFHVTTTKLVQPHIHFDLVYDSYSENVFISFRDYEELSSFEKRMIRKNVFPQLSNNPFLKISDPKEFLECFYAIIFSKSKFSLTTKANMLRILELILSDNVPDMMHLPESSSNVALLIKSYIDVHYQQNFTLDDLAQQFGYSKYYIEKRFQKTYGESVIQYKNKKRLTKALVLLKEYSVSETADILGYSSVYAFSRAFRTFYGNSPKNCKK